MSNDQALRPVPGMKVRLHEFNPGQKWDWDKDAATEELTKWQARLEELQELLYADGSQSLLIVLQAMDAGGKDGTIEKVFDGVNPQGVMVTNFKAPTPEELARDFLWRIHKAVPAKGYIGIFNRSHYEDVLVVRVNELVPPDVWKKRYDQINQFEKILSENGTRILKFFLHISKDEQKARLQARLDDPTKQWKFSLGDLPVRQQWDAYMKAYEDVLTKCNTDYAPWHIIPANRKWVRNLAVIRTIVETLQDMKLSYPPAAPGLDQVVIPD